MASPTLATASKLDQDDDRNITTASKYNCGLDSNEDEVVPNVQEVSLVDEVFDGAFGGDGDDDFVIRKGVVVSSSAFVKSTKSCLGGMVVSLIFLKGLEDEAWVEAMGVEGKFGAQGELGEKGVNSDDSGLDSNEDEVVPKVEEVSLVDRVFDSAFGGDGDDDFVIREGVVVSSSSFVESTKSYLGGMVVSLIFFEGLEDEAWVGAMGVENLITMAFEISRWLQNVAASNETLEASLKQRHDYGLDSNENKVVLKVEEVSLVDRVFDGAFGGDGDDGFCIKEGLENEAWVEAMRVEMTDDRGLDSNEDEEVLKVEEVSLVDGVFDGAFGGDGDDDFIIREGIVVSSSSFVKSTKSWLGEMMAFYFLRRIRG
nr:hypothetical protein [Tanacetum cinerariifolium]